MCFGGGSKAPPVNVPTYSPDEAYTAVKASQEQATDLPTKSGGLQDRTLAPPSAPTTTSTSGINTGPIRKETM